jgi:hypothetical protein
MASPYSSQRVNTSGLGETSRATEEQNRASYFFCASAV